MSLDLALIGFKGEDTAASVFGKLRDSVGSATPWTSEVAIVEHLAHDRLSVRGTFASRYVDVEETDHVWGPGAAEGALDPTHVDALLSALGESDKATAVRRPLTAEQASALIASIAADPLASRGPTKQGDSAAGRT
jgi:hypothetical protein